MNNTILLAYLIVKWCVIAPKLRSFNDTTFITWNKNKINRVNQDLMQSVAKKKVHTKRLSKKKKSYKNNGNVKLIPFKFTLLV